MYKAIAKNRQFVRGQCVICRHQRSIARDSIHSLSGVDHDLNGQPRGCGALDVGAGLSRLNRIISMASALMNYPAP